MKKPLAEKGYYFITDRRLSRHGNAYDVSRANEAGVPFIQYREKDLPSRQMYEEAVGLKALCSRGRFLVNDRLDIALAVEADGMHLGQTDLPLPLARRLLGRKRVIGVSVRTLAEALQAEADGADYVGIGPVFATATKADAGAACGIEIIILIKQKVRLPVVAIGGITLANAPEVIAAGADMISAISAVVAAEDSGIAIRRFEELFA